MHRNRHRVYNWAVPPRANTHRKERNRKPSSFLSGAFNDANSDKSLYYRTATETTVNVSCLTGATETTSTSSSGGFHNLIRYPENWNGKRFNWSGSAVHPWYSQYATGQWSTAYYSPSVRSLQYDTDLDDPTKLPPETPVVRIFQRTGRKQTNVGYSALAAEVESC